MIKLSLTVAVTCLCVSSLTNAQALERAWYATADVSATRFDVADSFDESLQPDSTDHDLNDFGFGVGLGYAWYDWLAFELSYRDLGEIQLRGQSTLPAFRAESDVATKTVGLDAVLSWPLTEAFYGQARIGFARWDLEIDSRLQSIGEDVSAQISDTGNSLLVGLGVGYRLDEQWQLGAEYTQVEIGDSDLDVEEDHQSVRISVRYRF